MYIVKQKYGTMKKKKSNSQRIFANDKGTWISRNTTFSILLFALFLVVSARERHLSTAVDEDK